jgi:hypothetical protein
MRDRVGGSIMQGARLLLTAAFLCAASTRVFAVEGPTAAGPIGGTDIRSAQLPPPGLYGGVILLGATAFDFVDGHGKTIPALAEAHLTKYLAGPFLYYVPDVKVLGGSLGIGGIVPLGDQCGHLFIGEPNDCTTGVGDPYAEIDWSRSFGKLRPSNYAGAYPILEGLTILAGFGVIFPVGTYDASDLTQQALSIGNNLWDFAPTVGFTYTTPPILAEGTELSARLFWNNYLENPTTHYQTGDLLDLEFAGSERIGRFQVGVTGFYAFQVEDDELLGVAIPPDGRRATILELGPVINFDMPEYSSSVKVKALATVIAENTVRSWGVVFGWVKKF